MFHAAFDYHRADTADARGNAPPQLEGRVRLGGQRSVGSGGARRRVYCV